MSIAIANQRLSQRTVDSEAIRCLGTRYRHIDNFQLTKAAIIRFLFVVTFMRCHWPSSTRSFFCSWRNIVVSKTGRKTLPGGLGANMRLHYCGNRHSAVANPAAGYYECGTERPRQF